MRHFAALSIMVLSALASSGAHSDAAPTPPMTYGAPEASAYDDHNDHTIILLHGMGRGRASLWVLDTRLQHVGYKTLNFHYGAHGYGIEDLAQQLCAFIEENVKTSSYHLIAHSLGNLILREAFRIGYPPGLGRIVMLAPPNQPAELARALRDNPIYRWFTGESGQLLASEAFYAQLPVPDVPFGIIAGNRGQSVTLKEPNDGVITVESTKLEGMADWAVVPQAHTFIMNSRTVAELCIAFIESGHFNADDILADAPADTTVPEATAPDHE